MSLEFINAKKLAARIAELKEELAQLLHLESFVSKKPKRGRKASVVSPTKKRRSKKRGAMSEAILKFLQPKGKDGAHVKDISEGTGFPKANVTSWFYTTGKKNKGIKKHGGNVFSYVPKGV